MKFPTPVRILLLLLLVLIGWNYWLHSAWELYNKATRTDSGELYNVDFFAYYNAGSRFLNNDNPYFWGKDAQNNPIFSDFIYPPPVLPLFSLLSRIPYDLARLIWLIILLTRRIKLPWLGGIGAGIALVMAKVYGFPILDSLNLWGVSF